MFLERQAQKKRKHAKEVAQFLVEVKKKLDPQFLVIASIDEELFYQKLSALAQKWLGINAPIEDCDGKRLINNLLIKEINNHYFIAIVADRLDYFIQSFEQQNDITQRSLISWLEVACICGAKKIVYYILGKVGYNILTQSRNIIPYAVSSGDVDLAVQMAQLARILSVTNPGLINLYSFGNFTIVEQINRLFTETPPIHIKQII